MIEDQKQIDEGIKRGDFDFSYCIFLEEATFNDVTFEKEADFEGATFKEKADFSNAVFKESAYFSGAIFEKEAVFNMTIFNQEFAFNEINKGQEQKDFELDLKYAYIKQGMDYTGTVIHKAKNRETFLILKNSAIKNNDQVKALEFHTKEMEQYKADLQKPNQKAKWSDKAILWFEEKTSYFGTDPLRAILYLSGLNLLWIFFFTITISGFYNITYIDSITLIDYNINPFHLFSNVNDKVLENEETLTNRAVIGLLLLSTLNLLKNILTAILIYETIKSFRKYSRRL